MTPTAKIKAVTERMRTFFMGSHFTDASKETVEKWAREIEAALKEMEK